MATFICQWSVEIVARRIERRKAEELLKLLLQVCLMMSSYLGVRSFIIRSLRLLMMDTNFGITVNSGQSGTLRHPDESFYPSKPNSMHLTPVNPDFVASGRFYLVPSVSELAGVNLK